MISLRTFLFAAVGANAAVVAPTEPVVGAFPEPVVKPIKQADGTTEQAVKEDDVVSTAVPSELGEGEREVADLEDFADVDITAEEEQALLAEEMLEEMFEEEAFAEMMEFEQAMELEVLLEHIGAEIRKVEARKHDEAVAGKYGEPMRKLQVKVDEIEQKLLEAEDAAWKPVEKAEIAGEKAFLAKINEEKFQKDEAALSDEEKEALSKELNDLLKELLKAVDDAEDAAEIKIEEEEKEAWKKITEAEREYEKEEEAAKAQVDADAAAKPVAGSAEEPVEEVEVESAAQK